MSIPAAGRHWSVLALALGFSLTAGTVPARAGFDVITGDLVRLADGPGVPGGVFSVDVLGRGTTSDFNTFCVEMTEHIFFNTSYYVENVGLSTSLGNKTLGAQSAWLYTQFLDKNTSKLVGYNFANPTPTLARDQANALQLGIWKGLAVPYSLTDIINLSGWNSTYINLSLMPILNPWLFNFQSDLNNHVWFGTGSIQVMNLRAFNYSPTGAIKLPDGSRITLTDYAQDQLVSVTPELPSLYSACTVVGCALFWGIFSAVRKRALAISAA